MVKPVSKKYRAWHVAFVPLELIQFQGAERATFAFLRFVLRRYSATEGGWIYARLGTRAIGDFTS